MKNESIGTVCKSAEERELDNDKNTHPEATTGTYAGLCAPPRAHTKYSKWAAIAASENPGLVNLIV
jgi:hypothetical protein